MRVLIVLALSLMPSLAFADSATATPCGAPAAMPDGWPVAAPANAGLHPALIWLGQSRIGGRAINWVPGVGWGGQKLYLVPALDLVVAITAGDYEFFPSPNLVGNTTLDIALRAALQN